MSKKNLIITIRIDEKSFDSLNQLSENLNLSNSQIVRSALIAVIEFYKKFKYVLYPIQLAEREENENTNEDSKNKLKKNKNINELIHFLENLET